jgi:hypothetical protein
MIDHTMLVAWRAWHERNKVTHDKPIPSTEESSKKFLCNYMKILGSIKDTPTDQILKGKRPVLLAGAEPRLSSSVKKPPNIPWLKSPPGWVKLSIDGSFKSENFFS